MISIEWKLLELFTCSIYFYENEISKYQFKLSLLEHLSESEMLFPFLSAFIVTECLKLVSGCIETGKFTNNCSFSKCYITKATVC